MRRAILVVLVACGADRAAPSESPTTIATAPATDDARTTAVDAAIAIDAAPTCDQSLAAPPADYGTFGDCMARHVDSELAGAAETERQRLTELRARAREMLAAMRAMGFEYYNAPVDSRPGVDHFLEEQPMYDLLAHRAGRLAAPAATGAEYAASCRGIFDDHIAMKPALRRHIAGKPKVVQAAARKGRTATVAATKLLAGHPDVELAIVMRWCAGLGPAGVAD